MKKTSTTASGLNTASSIVLMASRFQFAAGERLLNSWVQSRCLLWCQEGRGRVRVNGDKWFTMEPDNFLFVPWQHDVLYDADPQHPMRIGGIHIIPGYPRERKLDFYVPHNEKKPNTKFPWRHDVAWPGLDAARAGIARPQDPLRLLAEYMIERFDAGPVPEATLRQLAQLFVEEIARTLTQKPAAAPGNDIVHRAQEVIEGHLGRPIALHQLARLSGCSVSTLRRQFQRALGMPPYEWILQSRMRRARRLLSTTTLRIKEVAEHVGFDDPFQFSRTFRQRVGKSPRHYRADHAFAPKASA